MADALISIKPHYVEQILSGEKRFEIRRRRLNIEPGTRLWIYSTKPSSRIEVVARVGALYLGTPEEIWQKISGSAGLSAATYNAYLQGSQVAFSLELTCVQAVASGPDLHTLRLKIPEFHPPQFFSRLPTGSPILQILKDSLKISAPGCCVCAGTSPKPSLS